MKHYSSIDDLPIFNWNKVHETGELKYLLHDPGKKLKTAELNQLPKIWESIYDEFIQKVGLSESYLEILESERKIALLQIEMAETGDNNIQTFIEIDQVRLERKQNEMPEGDFYQLKSFLEKKQGHPIDIRKCSVIEFYSYIKTLEK
jgi:hypothetical protein